LAGASHSQPAAPARFDDAPARNTLKALFEQERFGCGLPFVSILCEGGQDVEKKDRAVTLYIRASQLSERAGIASGLVICSLHLLDIPSAG
jgi:hypothetical protein